MLKITSATNQHATNVSVINSSKDHTENAKLIYENINAKDEMWKSVMAVDMCVCGGVVACDKGSKCQ